jgi:hypothetical protein
MDMGLAVWEIDYILVEQIRRVKVTCICFFGCAEVALPTPGSPAKPGIIPDF